MPADELGDIPEFKSFSKLSKFFEEFQDKAYEFFNRVLEDHLGAAEVADRMSGFLKRLFQLQHYAKTWIEAADRGQLQSAPGDFDPIHDLHLVVQMFALEATFHLTAIDVFIFGDDLDGAGESYTAAGKSLRVARPYLRRLEGNRLRRWWSVLKRRLTLQRPSGIEEIRKRLFEQQSILRSYASLLGDPSVLDADELRKAIHYANETLVGFVRELFKDPERTAKSHGAGGLAGRLVKLMELQMLLVPLPATFSTRRAMASLMVAVAYLHWGMALAIQPRHLMAADKQLLYARRALEQSRASYRRALQLILTTPFRWIAGTHGRAHVPEWKRLLPKGRELRHLQEFLRRQLQD